MVGARCPLGEASEAAHDSRANAGHYRRTIYGTNELMAVSQKLKVLFATSEVAPLIKTGGLADVSAALPVALNALGVDVRVLVPGYPQVMDSLKTRSRAAMLPGLPGVPAATLIASKPRGSCGSTCGATCTTPHGLRRRRA